MIKEDEPPKPSTRISSSVNLPAVAAARKTEPTRLARQMQGELDWIVMKCLEKDRARRYETANGLARDLHRYLHDEPVEACPPSAGYKLRKFASKYQKWLAVAGAFVFVLVAGTAISMFQAVRASLAQAEARKERDTAAKALAQAEAVIQFLAKDLLGQANPERNERGQKVTVEELLMKAADRIENQPRLAEQPEVEATLRLVIGNSLHKLGQPRSAQPHLSRAVSLRRQALGPDHPATLTAQEDYVFFLLEEGLGDLKENAGLSRATWEARSRVLGPEHVDTLDSLDTYCGALNHLGLDEEAEPLRRKCLETMRRVLGPKHPKTLQAMSNLGWSLIEQGNYADAEPIIDNCLQLEIEVLGPRHPETLPTRNNLGLCRMYLERFTEAEATLREALSISRESSGPNSKQSLFLESVLTRALSGAGKWDEAEELGRNALAGRREILPAGNVHIGQSLVVLGLVLVAKGKLAEADALLREALSIFRDKTDQDQWVAQAEVGRGTALAALGQFNDSEALLSSARSRFTHDRRIPPWQKRQSAEMLAQIYEQAGKINQAASWRTNPANETSK
jgi:tetratricopeptide (TPR) repeat protein